ncbi:uncharacterized protein EDB91DRAFT_1249139 [Suillus paluster]|uniref:uncharacterized protein n=1 Tax=Suillus paluster TaxID=48578 RepID=UPI001B87AE68|nr:uncharacterized protein EDB91DRAFT_1249139 [Suillus paluster]KAG1738617.1 hypothetical protein EDB91DRAFT_1249139 [Suillus paluster]
MLDLFSKDRIVNEAGLRAALHHLDAISTSGATGLQATIEHLLSSPHVFAYIISVWDRSERMILQILTDFPTKSQEYPSSLASKVLDNLSIYFLALPIESLETEVSRDISRHRGFIEGALPLLRALSTMKFSSANSFEDESDLFDIEPDEGFVKMKVHQKMRKRHRQKPQHAGINTSLFARLDVAVPTTSDAATALSTHILTKLKQVLSLYLSLLRWTELADDIKALLFPNVEESARDVAPKLSSPEDVESSTESSVYPMVQPMKAALYFDNADGFGEWRILVSTEAYNNLREYRRADREIFKIIFKTIRHLSRGHFSSDNQKRLDRTDAGIPYQIDCIPDQDGESERQVIKVYGIYEHSKLERISWNALSNHLARKGTEYRRRCIFRTKAANDVILPASFSPAELEPEITASPLDLSAKDMDDLHALLVLEKYVTFSQAFLHSLIANEDVHHAFMLSSQEWKVVECTTSCYVLGRSGTGKTTTMLYKILGIQRAWESSGIDMPKPRQIFVTKSRTLATKVGEDFTRLLKSLTSAGSTLQELAKLKAQSILNDLVDHDDAPESQMNIPMRYSQLEDKHFPLFVTFDQLAKMIAADVFDMDDPKTRRSAELFFNTDDAETHDSLVTYNVFKNQYWPHFPQGLTKNLSSAASFAIHGWFSASFWASTNLYPIKQLLNPHIGIIKGSEQALSCPDGVLDRSSYLRISRRSNPISANHMDSVYDIFEIYKKFKKYKYHLDVADRTHAILKVLGDRRFPGRQIDYLYVDEAQDNLLIDALVLRRLCRNPDGLFWAADTAQAISAGSSFRFDDLKAFIYRVERQSILVNSARAPVHQPTMFQLGMNYRSHGGIVNCAHSVIELITKFWPDSIDHLQPEKGMVDGVKPIFFTGPDDDTRCKQFLVGERDKLGPNQCILVRNDAACQKLREQVGDIGIIMTLYESKGLEFDDVLLYGFFEDSVIDASRWRVILNGVDSQGYAPDFYRDEARYAGICSELKHLYVGITRARKNMRIFDRSDKSDAMRIFWTFHNLIENRAHDSNIPPLAVSFDPDCDREEWASTGRSLFLHKLYSQAMHCFQRGGLLREVKVCEAYILREAARSSVGVASPNVQQKAFITAADAFADCGAAATGNEKRQYYRTSADCYVRGGKDLKAADTYLAAQEFGLAAKRYRKAGSFDRTLRVLTDYRTMIPEETATGLWTACRLYYCRRSNNKAPLPLFSSSDEELEFLEAYGLDYARVSLLESHSRYYEVAELHLSENRPMEAAQAFLEDNRNVDSAARAADALLESLWRECSFRITRTAVADDSVQHSIALTNQLQMSKLEPVTRDLVLMFQSILGEDHESLKKLALAFQEHNNPSAALHCLDHFFSQVTDIRSFQVHEMAGFLETFHTYARLLYQFSTLPDPLESDDVLRLFSIVPLSGDEFLIPHGTFLYDNATETSRNNHLVSMHQSGYTASRRHATELIHLSIRTVLEDKVLAVDEMCCDAPVFLQCLPYIVSGTCRRARCPQEHVTISNLDRVQYNAHVAIHIQQILILQLLYSAHPSTKQWESMRDWIDHLYEALNPPLFIQGSLADLDLTLIPHGLAGLRVVRNWTRESFYKLDPFQSSSRFLTTLMRITSLSFAFDRNDAPAYIAQADCVARNMSTELLRKADNRRLVFDMLNSYRGFTESSISSGILYLQHVLDHRLRVNLSVLCDYIEDVLSSFVINHRMDPAQNGLHGVVLPSNWLIFPHKFSANKHISPESVGVLFDAIRNLIETLRTDAGTDFLRLAHTNVTRVLCSIFIFRLCRILCLVAHNTRDLMIKRKVNLIVLHLHIHPPPWHPAYYRKLVDDVVQHCALLPGRGLPRLDGYLRAVLAFDNCNAASDLVHLVHKMTPQPTRISSVRQLFYERASEIPYLLSSHTVAAQSALRVEAATFVPRVQRPKDDVEIHQDHKEKLEPTPQESDGEEAEGEEAILVYVDTEAIDGMENMEQAVTSLDLQDESLRFNGPSKDEDDAARKIQDVYRRYHRYRSSPTVDAETEAIFMTCLKETRSPRWHPGYYRLLFLGPLPHLLVCLERGITLTHAAKEKTKRLLNKLDKESHEKLEELGRQTNEITVLLKKGLQLRKQLEPSSPYHHARDIGALKRAVREVDEFMQRVPGNTEDMQTTFQVAFRGIVAVKKVVSKEKPALNVEDV